MIIQLTYKSDLIKDVVSIHQLNDPVSGAIMFRFLKNDGATFLCHPDEIRSIEEETQNEYTEFQKALWGLAG